MPHARFVSAESLFSSDRFTLRRETFATSDGQVVRPVIHHPGAVAIIAQPEPTTLVLVRQFRYPIRRWTLEIPAGTRVVGEAPETTARRELREEAGYTATTFTEVLRCYPAVGVSDEELLIYHATDLQTCAAAPEHGELVSREVVPLHELAALQRSGEICDAKTLLALTWLGLPLVTMAAGQGTV